MVRPRSVALAILATLGVSSLPGVARAAATITVTTLADASATDCSLRDAITAANTDAISGACPAGSGDDQIEFTVTGTINLGSALPAITSNVTIDGPATAADLEIRRNSMSTFRILSINGTVTVTVSDVTISNGLLTGLFSAGAGVFSNGTTTLDRVILTENSVASTSDAGDPAPAGGAVFNSAFMGPGSMTIRQSTFSGNSVIATETAASGTQTAQATGGALSNTGSVTIERSTLSGNTVAASVATSDASSSALAAGGAIHNNSVLVLKQSTVSGNDSTATATPPAVTTERGAVYNQSGLTVTGSTIAFNGGAGSANLSAQGIEGVTSSIISNPQGGPNCDGSIDSDGAFNIEFPNDCVGITGLNSDPLLRPLGDNGGPTETHGLPSGSPAVDAGTSSSEVTDQRGYARVVDLVPANAGDGSDVGALERQESLGTTIDTGPFPATNDPTPTFTFHATAPVFGFECSIDTGTPSFGPCQGSTGTHTPSTSLADGLYAFRVRGFTVAGVPDPDPAEGEFLVDTEPPTDPTVTSPSHQVGVASADPTVDVAWSGATDTDGSGVSGFSFDWTTTPTHVPDQVEDADETATGTTSPPLSNGQHWFHLRTSDQVGNWTSTVHLGPFAIDTGAPDTTVTKAPKKKIVTTKKRVRVNFRFASSEPGATFECRRDGGAWTGCTSPQSFKVKRGRHRFQTRATDQAGNTDPTPALRRFRVVRA